MGIACRYKALLLLRPIPAPTMSAWGAKATAVTIFNRLNNALRTFPTPPVMFAPKPLAEVFPSPQRCRLPIAGISLCLSSCPYCFAPEGP
jgi:hypothetical protein